MEQAWGLPYPGDDGDDAGCGIGNDQSNYLGRRMEVLKTNLCRYPEAMGVTFRPVEGNPEVAEIVYGEAPASCEEMNKREECGEWLLMLLEEWRELQPREVIEMATEEGYSESTVYRARKELGEQVVDTQGRQHPNNTWALAGQDDEDVEIL